MGWGTEDAGAEGEPHAPRTCRPRVRSDSWPLDAALLSSTSQPLATHMTTACWPLGLWGPRSNPGRIGPLTPTRPLGLLSYRYSHLGVQRAGCRPRMPAPLSSAHRIHSWNFQSKITSLEEKERPQNWPLGWSAMQQGQSAQVDHANLTGVSIPPPAPPSLTSIFFCPPHPSLAHSTRVIF